MKKGKVFGLILISIITLGCEDLFDVSDELREFQFKNYTDNSYLNTTISAAQIEGDKIIVKHSENLSEISPKGNSHFYETTTGQKKVWDTYLNDFIQETGDLGCFLIEFSDGRKLFIEVEYYEDGIFYGLNLANLFEIEIFDNEINANNKTENINSIPVDDYEIIYD